MHKNATKYNKTQSKWCINMHGASKIIDTFETYQELRRARSFDQHLGYTESCATQRAPCTTFCISRMLPRRARIFDPRKFKGIFRTTKNHLGREMPFHLISASIDSHNLFYCSSSSKVLQIKDHKEYIHESTNKIDLTSHMH
jgi:hypothetical protein